MTLDKVTAGYADTTYPKAEKAVSFARKKTGRDYDEAALHSVGPAAPESVKNAWMQAAEETGVNGYGITGTGMFSHISQMLVMRLQNLYNGTSNYNDVLGNTAKSALQAARQALYALEHPLGPARQQSSEVRQHIEKEKEFYNSFIEKLELLDKTDESAKENEQKTSGYTSEEMIQIIHGKIEEISEKIKNGETEPGYQIGSRSFTQKQWNKMIEQFDAVQEELRKLREEDKVQREKKAAKKENEKSVTVNHNKAEQNESIFEKLQELLSDETANSFRPGEPKSELEKLSEEQKAVLERNTEKLKKYL